MRGAEKILIIAGAAAGAFLLLRKSAPGGEVLPPQRAQQNIWRYADLMWKAGVQTFVDPAVIAAMVWTESDGDPNAIGGSGEVGLMQIMPSTAAGEFGITDRNLLLNPSVNVYYGALYLRRMLDRYGGMLPAGLAAYNVGASKVWIEAGGMVHAPEAGKNYARRVMSRVQRFRDAFRAMPGTPSEMYDSLFPGRSWRLDTASLEGLFGIRPRWGLATNVERWYSGRSVPLGAGMSGGSTWAMR